MFYKCYGHFEIDNNAMNSAFINSITKVRRAACGEERDHFTTEIVEKCVHSLDNLNCLLLSLKEHNLLGLHQSFKCHEKAHHHITHTKKKFLYFCGSIVQTLIILQDPYCW